MENESVADQKNAFLKAMGEYVKKPTENENEKSDKDDE
jgi:hypothetical protein